MNIIKIFVVYDISKGLYSTGGSSPHWVPFADCKKWTKISAVKNHLLLHQSFRWDPKEMERVMVEDVPNSWIVREVELIHSVTEEYDARSILKAQK